MAPTLGAAVIVRNERHNLAGLWRSLDWVDHIVVVDGGSNDDTLDLAHALAKAGKAAATVWERPFDTFHVQRNFALDHLRTDWVLSIDADERATPRFAEEVRRRMLDPRKAAYRTPIRSTIFGRKVRFGGTQDDRPVRLFRRSAARWNGAVHERLEVSGRVGLLDQALEHHTLPDLASFLEKMHRYTDLEAAARVARAQAPRRFVRWTAPPREVFRRLVWKQGVFDGPTGWRFALLSGLSEWVLANKHRELWGRADREGAGRDRAKDGCLKDGKSGQGKSGVKPEWACAS